MKTVERPKGNTKDETIAIDLTNLLHTELSSRKDNDQIEIATLTSFEWDRLYLFGEHTSAAAINSALGTTWMQDNSFYVEELSDLLVFAANSKVVGYALVTGDLFAPPQENNGFLRDEAIFTVREVDDPNRPKVLLPPR